MTSVIEINDIASLGEHRAAWQRLLAKTPDATFFQSLEWLETYWQHYATSPKGCSQRLRVLLVRSVGETVGILPLIERTERRGLSSLRFLTYPLDHWGSFYGPIGPCAESILTAGLEHVRLTRREWDALELRFVDADGTDGGAAERAMRAAGFPAAVSPYEQTSLFKLYGTWDEFLARQSSKWRNNYRRWTKRVEERGELTYVRHRPRGTQQGDDDPRWDLYEACEEVARRSWQQNSQTGTTITHESVRPFLRDLHGVAAKFGAADMNLLFLDGCPAAFAYNYCYRGNVFGLRIGFDVDAADGGLGNLMYLNALRDSMERGDRVYDLGPGSLDCKRYLATSVRTTYRLSHFRRSSPRGQFVRLKRAVQRWWSGSKDKESPFPNRPAAPHQEAARREVAEQTANIS